MGLERWLTGQRACCISLRTCSDPQHLSKCLEAVARSHLSFQHLGNGERYPCSKLANYTSQIVLWVQVTDPASIYKVKSDQG